MKIEEYIDKRLSDQINWYDSKSQNHQSRYKYMKISSLILAAAIPIYAAADIEPFKVYATLFSSLIGLSEAWLAINGDHTNWTKYRRTCESLRHEYYAYETLTGVYKNEEEPGKLLVERAESLVSEENVNWANIQNDYQVNQKDVY